MGILIIGLFIGLLLMVVGTIMSCACGMIKVIPRAALLGFAVIFVYIIALSIDISEANAIFVTSIPFVEQIKGFNSIVQQISNVSDWSTIYQVLSSQFVSTDFFDEVIKLWFFSFEVGLVHNILFPKRDYKWWYAWIILYLKECLAVGILVILNSIVIKIIESIIPDFVIVWLSRICMGLLVMTIILCAAKLVFKFVFPLLDIFISFFTKSFVGKLVISSVTTTGILILIAFAFIIFNIKIPQEIIIFSNLIPVGIVFLLVWYILYLLIGYSEK